MYKQKLLLRYNRLESWSWGAINEQYKYTHHGLCVDKLLSHRGSIKYGYNNWNKASMTIV